MIARWIARRLERRLNEIEQAWLSIAGQLDEGSFNSSQVETILAALNSCRRGKQRRVRAYLEHFFERLDETSRTSSEILNLMNEEAARRQYAVSSGAASYSDPRWAGPALAESLLQEWMDEGDARFRIEDRLRLLVWPTQQSETRAR